MTPQATNCLQLFLGGNPSTIKMLLKVQKPSIVKELQDHFGTSDIDTLAVRLSMGE